MDFGIYKDISPLYYNRSGIIYNFNNNILEGIFQFLFNRLINNYYVHLLR